MMALSFSLIQYCPHLVTFAIDNTFSQTDKRFSISDNIIIYIIYLRPLCMSDGFIITNVELWWRCGQLWQPCKDWSGGGEAHHCLDRLHHHHHHHQHHHGHCLFSAFKNEAKMCSLNQDIYYKFSPWHSSENLIYCPFPLPDILQQQPSNFF